MTSYTLVTKGARDVVNFAAETPRLTLKLAQLIRRHDARLVYANNSRTFVWGTLGACLGNCPIIWHVHNVIADSKTHALITILARQPQVRSIICPSESAAAQFTPQDKVVIVPYGVDLDRFAPSLSLRPAARAGLGISPNAPVVGIVGDLIPLKGQALFIQAAQQLLQHLPEAVFLIIGGERPTEESHHYKTRLELASGPHIRMLGFRPDIPAILNALDILVIASTTETGPLVLLQALATGVPVVSTPVGRAPKLLSDGSCGLLFPKDNADELAHALSSLIQQPETRHRMGEAGRRRVLEDMGLEPFRARILAQIEEALQGANAHHV